MSDTAIRSTSAPPPPDGGLHQAPAAHPDHRVQFYEDEGFLCDAVARFLGAGLGAGGPLVVIATEAHREGICACLRASACDVERARSAGLLTLLDARETLAAIMVDGMPSAPRFRALVGGLLDTIAAGRPPASARAFGEMVDILCREGNRRGALRLEDLWNELGRDRSFSLLCAYAMTSFRDTDDEQLFRQVCDAHTHVELARRPFDLIVVLRAALEILTPAAIAKGVTLDARIASGAFPFHGDADRIQQVFWNLFVNAIRFTPKDGRVEVRLAYVGPTVELVVHDTGSGIPADFLPHVFERFRQAGSSTGPEAGGLGLGLAITRYLVELHGGTVKAESPGEGRGATFTVTLPIPHPKAEEGAPERHRVALPT